MLFKETTILSNSNFKPKRTNKLSSKKVRPRSQGKLGARDHPWGTR